MLEIFRADYRVLRDIATFALSEDYRVGPSMAVTLRYSEPALLSSVRFLEGKTRLRYAFYQKDDLFIANLVVGARYQPRGSTAEWAPSLVNRQLSAEVVNYSPVIGPGRFAARGYIDILGNDLNNTKFFLGGGNGLRGVPAESLTGTTRLLLNLEYRTKPLDFHTLHLGGVLFWDAGRAWGAGTTSPFAHTIGIGLRGLLPQFNLETLRIDFGYVLRGPVPSSFLDRFSASFGQVFDYRPAF
jgi:outer membrane translocation and assembly module TamA